MGDYSYRHDDGGSKHIRNVGKLLSDYKTLLLLLKSKAVPLHAMEACEGRGGIASTHT
jgi:hypothetical protein